MIVKISKSQQILGILDNYFSCIETYFSDFKSIASDVTPISIGVSVSNVKYPFFEHWRVLNEPKSSVYINLVGKGEVRASLQNLEEILIRAKRYDRKGKTALHKLAEVAKISEKLVEITLKDKTEKDRKYYNPLLEMLPMGLKSSDILTLAKLLEDKGD